MKNNVYFILPQYESKWKVSLASCAPPTGPTYLYSAAKQIHFGNYNDGRCIDLTIHNEMEVLNEIRENDLVCLTTIVSNYNATIDFAQKAKERGALIALGGPWTSEKAEQILQKHPWIDYVVKGVGEPALEQILTGTARKGIIQLPECLVSDIPLLDFSGWDFTDLLQYQENYTKMLQTGLYGVIPDQIPFFVFYQSSRGCVQKPRCGFCGSRLGKKYDARSDKQFYNDIEHIIKQISPINERIHIFDCSDSFTSGLDRFEGYHSFPGVTFTIYARADEITLDRAQALREMGVTKVSMGIETGSPRSMGVIGKNVKRYHHFNAVNILSEVGIAIYANLIYGCPGEDKFDVEKTVDHFESLVEGGNFYRVAGRMVTPLPNSKWYFELLKKIRTDTPSLKDQIHYNDTIDVVLMQNLWLNYMTQLTESQIQMEHERLVRIADKYGVSLSSRVARGIC